MAEPADSGNWHLAFQGQLREIRDTDARLLRSWVRDATGAAAA
jgi:hypothetical protein